MKKAIMYGGGNIGRGFIAQLFCLSGWETVFVDVNTALVDDMNTRHEYPIFITGAEDYERFTVTNVRAVCGSVPAGGLRRGTTGAELSVRLKLYPQLCGVARRGAAGL